MTFTDIMGATPRSKLLDFLGDHPATDYTITEMAENTGVSRPTLYAIVLSLQEKGLLLETRRVGQSRFFRINTKNRIVQEILRNDMLAATADAERPPAPARHR